MMALLAALCLAAETPEETHEVIIVEGPRTFEYSPKSVYLRVTEDDPECSWSMTIENEGKAAEVVWFRDHRTVLSRSELRPGVRVRVIGEGPYRPRRIEVVSLGPLAMDVAVEEWVIGTGARPTEVLTPGEMATMEALASPSWLVRDAVSRAIRDKGARALRLLCWAKKSPDREVRARAESLLRVLGSED